MPVSTPRKEYINACNRWDLVQKIVDNNAACLLRNIDPEDPKRTSQYRDGAVLVNYTRLTLEGLTGLVFRKDSENKLPEQISYITNDATGMYFSLDQLAQQAVAEVLKTGRFGLLAEMPEENKFEEGSEKLARIRGYCAHSILNWGYEDYGNEYKLSLVVLKECADYLNPTDNFEWIEATQYRALRLIDGVYVQELYNQNCELVSVTYPTDYSGNFFNYIPFSFIGSENNDADIDNSPLYDIAVLNKGLYQNSADVEEASFIAGQPVPVVAISEGTSSDEFAAANPGGIVIGSRKGVIINGDFKFAQVQANILPQSLMKDKADQIVSIGARIIAPPGVGRETAEGVMQRYHSANSRLHVIVNNVDLGFQSTLYDISKYMMETPSESVYELNKQFYEEGADPNLIAQQILSVDRGIMTRQEVRDNMSRAGIALDESLDPETIEVNPMAGINEPPQ